MNGPVYPRYYYLGSIMVVINQNAYLAHLNNSTQKYGHTLAQNGCKLDRTASPARCNKKISKNFLRKTVHIYVP